MSANFDTHEVLNQASPLEEYDVFGTDRALGEAVDREGRDVGQSRAARLG